MNKKDNKIEITEKKIHKLCYPLISCYPHHANLVAGIMTNDFDMYEIISNYVQLVYRSDINRIDFNCGMDILNFIKNYPYVDSYCYDRVFVKEKFEQISDFIKYMIERECFVHLLVDTFYLPAYKRWYQQKHIIHNIMIYGYDNEYLYVADNFMDGKYSFEKIYIEDFNNSMIHEKCYDWLDGIHCWRFKEEMYLGIGLNSYQTKKLLREYLKSIRSNALTVIEDSRRGKDYHYGVEIYDKLTQYVEISKNYLDVRIPYVLVEHKRVLKYICNKLYSQYCLENYKESMQNLDILEKKNVMILNLFLKYNMTKREDIRQRVINNLVEAKEMEIEILGRLYNDVCITSKFKRPKFVFDKNNLVCQINNEIKGDWKRTYGNKGYYIMGDQIRLPEEISVFTNNCVYVSLLRDYADDRGLERAEDNTHLVAYYLHNKEFNIELQTKKKVKISLYVVDYDKLKRTEDIYVQNKNTGLVIMKQRIENFEDGKYVTFEIKEDAIISFRRIKGPDAVLSAIFFD